MNTKKILIFGVTDFSKAICDYISLEANCEIAGFVLNKNYMTESSCQGFPVIPYEEVELHYPPEEYQVVVTVGYNEMNVPRARIMHDFQEKKYEMYTYIHPSATVLTNDIGEGTIVMEGVIIGQNCKIGKGNIIGTGAMIGHHCIMGDYNFMAGRSAIGGKTIIGSHCMIGLNSTVRDGIHIADYTLVGAASYISKNTEMYGVYLPAKTVKINKSSTEMTI